MGSWRNCTWILGLSHAIAQHDLDERFYRARDAFSAPRFKALCRAWKQDGESALATARSHVISDAVEAGAGSIDVLELGHRYGHLSLLATVA